MKRQKSHTKRSLMIPLTVSRTCLNRLETIKKIMQRTAMKPYQALKTFLLRAKR